jgi:hypothetical protein
MVECDAVGTIYPNPRDLSVYLEGDSITVNGNYKYVCPNCNRGNIIKLQPATDEEIIAAGFLPFEYQ